MPNKTAILAFKQLRVYNRLSIPLLFNDMACNRIMKLNYFVNHAPAIYRLTSRLLGKNFINHVIHSTYCKVFTAGNTIQQADETSQYFRAQGIPVIIDYCAEGDIHNPDLEGTLEDNAKLFAQSANLISRQKNEMISIKMTGLLDMRILKTWNDAVEVRDRLWSKNSTDGQMGYAGIVKGVKEIDQNISEQDIIQYLKAIHQYQGDPKTFTITEIDFKINHQPYYIFQHHKNSNKVVQKLFPISTKQVSKIKDFIRRLTQICQPHLNNKNNFRILVDAEQTYVQKAIQVVTEQLQEVYNKERAYIIPTIQNYLKRSIERGLFQIKLSKHKNLKFGAKLVRGAYIVQQTKLANQHQYPNPIVDLFQETTTNYLTNFKTILDNISEGEVIVATHNQDTIQQAVKIKQAHSNPPTVSFAQLLGLADHLTIQLRARGLPVYKYLPWAQTEVMVPYMIRRAQELNQMKYPLDLQYELLKHELWLRIRPY